MHSYIRQKFFVDRVINVWNALPSTTNFASLNVFRNSIEKIDLSSFLVCNIFICVTVFIERFRAAVSVFIGPCCPALLESYLRKCAYCCIIEQIKWWTSRSKNRHFCASWPNKYRSKSHTGEFWSQNLEEAITVNFSCRIWPIGA